MDEQQAFKVGLLTKCAELGLTPDETLQLVKRARARIKSASLSDIGDDLVGSLASAGTTLGTAGGIGALVAPPLLGWGAGYGLSRLLDIDDTDVEATKTQELIDEYRRAAELHKRRSRSFRMPAHYPVSAPPKPLFAFAGGQRGAA